MPSAREGEMNAKILGATEMSGLVFFGVPTAAWCTWTHPDRLTRTSPALAPISM